MKSFLTHYWITSLSIWLCLLPFQVWAQRNKNKATAVTAALPDYKALSAGFSKEHQKLLQLSDTYFKAEQYAEAIRYYKLITSTHPDHTYISYQLAECYRHLFNYPQAEVMYGKVSYADSSQYPKAVFYYGLMQKMNGKYAYAIHTFDIFIKQAADLNEQQLIQKNEWVERARLEQDGCQSALIREKFVQGNFQFKLLGQPVSSAAHDYAPALLGNDSLIAITSGRTDKNNPSDARLGEAFSDIYAYGRLNDSVWLADKINLPAVNTPWSDGAGFLIANGTKFYFTSCQGAGVNCAIFVTERKNNRWHKPVRLNMQVNEPGSDSRHPSLTPGGDTLYFVSNREGGYGLNDIWMSRKTSKEEWQTPVNMGTKVNTAHNDVSPFYHASDKQFFFASDGRVGFGGLDLYYLNLTDNFAQRTAINLGPPFNSNRDDAFLVLGQEKGFLSSNRDGGPGNFDIYTFLIKSQQSELIALDKTSSVLRPDLAYLADFQFEYLPEEQKLLLDRIASKGETGRLYQTDLAFAQEEKQFYEQLSSSEKSRIANMISSLLGRRDSTAILNEDTYYYQKVATKEEKLRIERFSHAYRKALQDSSFPVLTEEDKFYYESLSHTNRNRLYRQIAGQLSKRISNDASILSQADKYYYETLSAVEKDRINRMAAARLAARLNGYDEQFIEEDIFYYQSLPPQEKNRLNRLMAARTSHFQEALDTSLLTEEDRTFYEKLSSEEKLRIDRMAAARHTAALNVTTERFKEEDSYHYEQLSSAGKDRLDRLMAARIAGRRPNPELAEAEADLFRYEQMSPEEKARINRMAAARFAARLNSTDEQFTEADRFFYQKLSPEEKAQMDRIIASRMGISKDGIDLSMLTKEEKLYYEQLPAIEKQRIERMAAARLAARISNTEEQFIEEDIFFYESLSPQEKNRLDHLIAARIGGGHAPLDQSLFEEGDQFVYEQMSAAEKDRINRMAAARLAARLNGTDEKFTEADRFFYQKLLLEERGRVDRLMAVRNAGKKIFSDQSTVDGNHFSFERITTENNRALAQKTSRKVATQLLADESVINGTTADDALSKLKASWMGQYKEVKLTGKLMDARTGEPAAGLPLPLVNGNGKEIKTTTTNPDGTFQYLNLPLSESLRIRIETPATSLTEAPLLYVEDMELTAYRNESKPVAFESAYFDFDSYVLKRPTAQILDQLVKYYNENPDIQIELNAFADEIGSDSYNLRLSNKRGLAVQKYLISKGVLPGSIVVYARGELKGNRVTRFGTPRPQPNSEARKVIINIQKNASQNHLAAETFVILADTDLQIIARKTGISIEKLRKLNGFKTNTIEPYRPVRIK